MCLNRLKSCCWVATLMKFPGAASTVMTCPAFCVNHESSRVRKLPCHRFDRVRGIEGILCYLLLDDPCCVPRSSYSTNSWRFDVESCPRRAFSWGSMNHCTYSRACSRWAEWWGRCASSAECMWLRSCRQVPELPYFYTKFLLWCSYRFRSLTL